MGLETAYFITQIVAAGAVVVSIVYLARQVAHSANVARSATRQEITNAAVMGARTVAGSDELAQLVTRTNLGEELERHEQFKVACLAFMITRNWENIHYQHLQGMLSETEWNAMRQNLKALLQLKLWRDYWERESDIYTDTFRREMERILEEIDAGEAVAARSTIIEGMAAATSAEETR